MFLVLRGKLNNSQLNSRNIFFITKYNQRTPKVKIIKLRKPVNYKAKIKKLVP